ncbi:hypothetical protein RvY_10878 [Ramazzottius varieornatus]|uniref:Uncharacterized protein n=1 Tax=Ramazzottius varieornatus TaxID=947166 RepID=A0A1D1VJN0_RAMVA|nr:hypothetical protein RvY_10878 [Ramazzottius varieornatus]
MDRQDALTRLRSLHDLERCLGHPACQLSDCDKGKILIVILEAKRVCEGLARGCCQGQCPDQRQMGPWCQRCPPNSCECPPGYKGDRGQQPQQQYNYGQQQGYGNQYQKPQQGHRSFYNNGNSNQGNFCGGRGPMEQQNSMMDFGQGFGHNQDVQEYNRGRHGTRGFGGDFHPGQMDGRYSNEGNNRDHNSYGGSYNGSQYNERLHELESNVSSMTLHQGMNNQRRKTRDATAVWLIWSRKITNSNGQSRSQSSLFRSC